MAGIEVLIGVPKHDVQRNIDLCRGLFTSKGRKSMMIYCDILLADLCLRENISNPWFLPYLPYLAVFLRPFT
jgi:hypothetical protein